MGVGSWLSRYVERGLVARFVEIELAVALVGGLSAPVLFLRLRATRGRSFRVVLYVLVFAIGVLVGLEIPLRDAHPQATDGCAFKELVAQVLTFDYLGALVVVARFSRCCWCRSSAWCAPALLFGLLNARVGAVGTVAASRATAAAGVRRLRVRASVVVAACSAAARARRDALTTLGRGPLYGDRVVCRETDAVPAHRRHRGRDGVRLFLNGNLQFRSRDEYRYHEALVHPAMAARRRAARACWCSAAATAWRCARCSRTRASSRSCWSTSTRR